MDSPHLQLLHPTLLQLQGRDDLGKSRAGDEREVGGGAGEFLVEAIDEGAEEEVGGDLLAGIVELVAKTLETHTKVIHGGVVLMAPEEFLLEEDKVLKAVVGEELIQLRPNGVGVVVILHHHAEEILQDGLKEPADESNVDG